jgi:hypothetical protein
VVPVYGSAAVGKAGRMSLSPAVADALERVLGRNLTSLHVAREHGRAIDALLDTLISPDFRLKLQSRRLAINAKWGGWDENDRKLLKLKPVAPTTWLGNRRAPERDFYMLREAAHQLLIGNGRLISVMVEALSAAEKWPVRPKTFRLWMLRTGVAQHVATGQYGPGPNAKKLVVMTWDDMAREIEGLAS